MISALLLVLTIGFVFILEKHNHHAESSLKSSAITFFPDRSVYIVLRPLEHQLLVTINTDGLPTVDGSKCLELILSQQVVNPTRCGGQMDWMFKKEVYYLRYRCYTCIAGSLYFPILPSLSSSTKIHQKKCISLGTVTLSLICLDLSYRCRHT